MNRKLILAIDGSESGLILLHQVLVHLGYRVVLAAGGAEAVRQAARHRPDAILLDLDIEGENPRETVRALATRGWAATTPVVALSDGASMAARGAPFAAIVRKPIVLPRLAETLADCLSAPFPVARTESPPIARSRERETACCG